MSPELLERLEILRRIGERGLKLAQRGAALERYNDGDEVPDTDAAFARAHEEHLDLWQHLLDELARVSSVSTPTLEK